MKLLPRVLKVKHFLPIFAFILGCSLTLFIGNFENCTNQNKVQTKPTNLLFILILSAPSNINQRNVIRETWLNKPKTLGVYQMLPDTIYIPQYAENGFLKQETISSQYDRLIAYKNTQSKIKFKSNHETMKFIHKFAIGIANLTPNEKFALQNEAKKHKDLIIINTLTDSYSNLTRKLLNSFEKVVVQHEFKYLLKCDDDTYVKLEQLLTDLHSYETALHQTNYKNNPKPELYWGYFHGRAHIKKQGQWKELNFNLCERYLPYALGGGYIISQNLVKYVAENANILSTYISEDISMGIWLTSFRNIYRYHDVRFDTAYLPRICRSYHIVLHKRTIDDMINLQQNILCSFKSANNTALNRPSEYFYNWNSSPLKCCDTLNV